MGEIIQSDNKEPNKLIKASDGAFISPRDIIDKVVSGRGTTVIEKFYQSKNEHTIRAYSKSIQLFAEFLGVSTADDVAAIFSSCASPPEAIELIESFREHLITEKLKSATINARLAALRSLLKLMYDMGVLSFTVSIKDQPIHRDPSATLGPPKEQVKTILKMLIKDTTDAGKRDLAIFTVFLEFALRRDEIHTLDIDHIEETSEGIRLYQLGKKRIDREWTPVFASDEGSMFIRNWLECRGEEPGPLFISFQPAKKNKPIEEKRLSAHGMWEIIRSRAKEAGVGLWKRACHSLRHAAITNFLDANDGDLRAAKEFARHKNMNTTLVYDDNRKLAVKDKGKKAAKDWWG